MRVVLVVLCSFLAGIVHGFFDPKNPPIVAVPPIHQCTRDAVFEPDVFELLRLPPTAVCHEREDGLVACTFKNVPCRVEKPDNPQPHRYLPRKELQ